MQYASYETSLKTPHTQARPRILGDGRGSGGWEVMGGGDIFLTVSLQICESPEW
jgi:hypothetical protein